MKYYFLTAFILIVGACSSEKDTAPHEKTTAVEPYSTVTPPVLMDYETNLARLRAKAKQGDVNARISLADLEYGFGQGDKEEEIRGWLEFAAANGNRRASVILSRGDEAALNDLAAAGEGSAYFELARRCITGRARGRAGGGFRPLAETETCKKEGSCGLLRKGAELGDGQSQFEYSFCVMQESQPNEHKEYEAMRWLEKAVVSGIPDAYLKLGTLMLNRKNGEYSEGIRLLGEGANKNCVKCALKLAEALWFGRVVAQDFGEAVKWWQEAANVKEPEAMLGLAVAYHQGTGVPKDFLMAYVWSNIAVSYAEFDEKTRPLAVGFRDKVALELSSEELAKAQKLSSDWKPGSITLRNNDPASAKAKAEDRASDVATPNSPIGTAFFVSKDGYLVTAHHVAAGCDVLRLGSSNAAVQLISTDRLSDVALLKANVVPRSVAEFRDTEKLSQGDDVVVYGYPLAGALSSEGVASSGLVAALQGLENNASLFQIDAPVQPGSSGGPVVDRSGVVVGVVVSKLNALRVAKATGDIPQNVNFAVKSRAVIDLLKANRVDFSSPGFFRFFKKDKQQIVSEIRDYVVRVDCERLRAPATK